MCLTTCLILLTATVGQTRADDAPFDYTTATVSPIVGLFILAVCLYFCCRNNSSSKGFRTLGNEDNPTRSNRWKNRRFFRRNNRNRNDGLPPNQTHVHVHPVLQLNPPQTIPVIGSAYHPSAMPSCPPSNDGHSNPLFMTNNSTYIPQMQPVPPPYV